MTIDQSLIYIIHHKTLTHRGRWLTLFSDDGHKIAGIYYADRHFRPSLFTPFYAVYKQRDDAFLINRLEPEYADAHTLKDTAMFCGLYLNELINRLYHDHQPSPYLFSCYRETISSLERGVDELALRQFEWALFEAQGTSLDLSKTANGEDVLEHMSYRFDGHHGGLIPTKQGISGRHLLDVAHLNFASTDSLRTAKYINRQLIDFLLQGSRLHSRELV